MTYNNVWQKIKQIDLWQNTKLIRKSVINNAKLARKMWKNLQKWFEKCDSMLQLHQKWRIFL